MLKNLFILIIAASFFVACGNEPTPNEEPSESGYPTFGEVITEDGAMPYGNIIAKVETLGENDSIDVKVSGKIESVCQKKGCWMNLTQEGQPEMFVRFKDYGFFMPLDASGKEVIMEGKAFKQITSVEELRHYAEDEGKTEEEINAITEPEEEVRFLASGVILLEKEEKKTE